MNRESQEKHKPQPPLCKVIPLLGEMSTEWTKGCPPAEQELDWPKAKTEGLLQGKDLQKVSGFHPTIPQSLRDSPLYTRGPCICNL